MKKGGFKEIGAIILALILLILLLVTFYTPREGSILGYVKEGISSMFDTGNAFLDDDTEVDLNDPQRALALDTANVIKDKFDGLIESSKDTNDCYLEFEVEEDTEGFIGVFENFNGQKRMRIFKLLSTGLGSILTESFYDEEFCYDGESIDEFNLKDFDTLIVRDSEKELTDNLIDTVIMDKKLNGEICFLNVDKQESKIIKQTKLNCEVKKEKDVLDDLNIKGEIEPIDYLIALMELYKEDNLNSKVLDIYYALWRAKVQNTINIDNAKLEKAFEIRSEALKPISEGEWFLCKDHNEVYRCMDLGIQKDILGQEVAIRNNCNLESGEIPGQVSVSENLTACEDLRLDKFGILPRF